MMPDIYDAIYLSPHLDDVVLSCGGQIASRCRHGDRVLVVTAFAGAEPEPPQSELVSRVHEIFGLRDEVIAERRREDTAACEHLGAEITHWDLPEAIYRRDSAGRDIYAQLSELFQEPRADDTGMVESLCSRLRELPRSEQVVCPLAVGGHVDHRLVRLAGEREIERLLYYEDVPYAEKRGAIRRALGNTDAWENRTVEIEESELEAKIEACAAYRSQLSGLYKSPDRMAKKMRRRNRKLGGERMWSRHP
jgi:LmbE family N-acetylglucosaminyl deacetylase